MPSKKLFYRAPGFPVAYHRDRQCFYLRVARSEDAIVAFRADDPGVGQSIVIPAKMGEPSRAFKSCARCGQ